MLTLEQQRRIMRYADRPERWTDYLGRSWKVAKCNGRLEFKLPSHAALRVHVFHRDDYRCCSCGVPAAEVPSCYDGRETLATATMKNGWPVLLVLDHKLARAAGGSHHVSNLQTLCETCNLHKLRHDFVDIRAHRSKVPLRGSFA